MRMKRKLPKKEILDFSTKECFEVWEKELAGLHSRKERTKG
jgi:hypothetical protein